MSIAKCKNINCQSIKNQIWKYRTIHQVCYTLCLECFRLSSSKGPCTFYVSINNVGYLRPKKVPQKLKPKKSEKQLRLGYCLACKLTTILETHVCKTKWKTIYVFP